MRHCAARIESPSKGFLHCKRRHGHDGPHEGRIVHFEYVEWDDGDREVRAAD